MAAPTPSSRAWVGLACLAWGALAPACTEYDLANDKPMPRGGEDTGEDTGSGGEPVSDEPDILVTPPAIDYGLVAVGTSVDEQVRILNEGGDTLHVTDVLVAEGADRGYLVTLPTALPFVLEPGEAVDVLVTFAPDDTGDADGLLAVFSDDPDEARVDVPLTNDVWMECDDSYSELMPWKKSDLWYGSSFGDQPVDSAGKPWYSPYYDDASWQVLGALPDHVYNTEDHDVFYRATFQLAAVVGTTEIEFEGNDGVWLYVNGQYVGHWGGEWREGGCINDPTGECSVNYEAPPVDVTAWLHAGSNTAAVMLTNGPDGYYLDIRATCTL